LGSIILAASKTGDRCADAEEAEALAIWEGLKLAVDHDLNPASLESDCAAAVAAVNSSMLRVQLRTRRFSFNPALDQVQQ
jgi:ribonuclease HI